MPKTQRQCACGRVFHVYPSQPKRHCSRACSSHFSPRKPRTGETVACAVCGTAFYRNPTEARKGAGVYCSQACHNVAQTKPAVVKVCAVCGRELRLKPSQAHIQFCSKSCEGTARTKRPLTRSHNGRPARLDQHGYVLVYEPTHPNRSMKGWQYEHRLVAEAALGRLLTSAEAVHHVNGVKNDNDPTNLVVMDGTDHAALSVKDYRDSINTRLARLAEYERRFGPLPKED